MYRVILLSLVFVFSKAYSESIVEHLNTNIFHNKIKKSEIDAAFLIRLQVHENLEDLQCQFKQYGYPLTEYNKFNQIPDNILTKYCSNVISPYLLTQILSHLSTYKYCIANKVHNALIVENQAYIVQNLSSLIPLVKKLNHSHKDWDILYTDVDYHHPTNGELIRPTHLSVNKQVLENDFLKLFCRYGTVSYVISRSGMKKILQYFTTHWPDLPYDQVLFKIPKLNIFSTNFDIITNRYTVTPEPHPSEPIQPLFDTKKEFWTDPVSLVSHDRFDVTAKYTYARYEINQYKTSWHKDLYKSHLETWIQFYDTNPLKVGYSNFISSFDNLIQNMKSQEFNEIYAIPINNLGLACNGAHRTGVALALNLPVKVKVQSGVDSPGMTSQVFRDLYHLEEKYLDFMAYTYAMLKANTRIVIAPQSHDVILKKRGSIVYEKDIHLTSTGVTEFARLTSYTPRDSHVHIYLYEPKDSQALEEVSQSEAFIPEQTRQVAATLFNQNSIDFMNRRTHHDFERFNFLMSKLEEFVQKYDIDREQICIDTGSVLSAYGLRDCNDMDILHKVPLPVEFSAFGIDSHNPHLHHHSKPLDEILFNPENHFYYRGFKFVSIDLVKKMKADRGSTKDINDIKLISGISHKAL